jgi:hypothetical protein
LALIYHTTTGPSTITDRYDPTIGVFLFSPLDILADNYQLGILEQWTRKSPYFSSCITLIFCVPGCQDQYVVHSFADMPLNLGGLPLSLKDQALHGHQIAPHTHDPLFALPPVGVFNWYYIQCVLKILHPRLSSNHHFALPFRKETTTTRVMLTLTMTETSQILLILLTFGNFLS